MASINVLHSDLYEDLLNEKLPTLNDISMKVAEEKKETYSYMDINEEPLFDFDIPQEISLEEDPFSLFSDDIKTQKEELVMHFNNLL